jgi:hypothetical protein
LSKEALGRLVMSVRSALAGLIEDWTIMDQIAVAALEIGNDTLAEVLFHDAIAYRRNVFPD